MYSTIPVPLDRFNPAAPYPSYLPQWQGNPQHAQALQAITMQCADLITRNRERNALRVFTYNLCSQSNWQSTEFSDLVLFVMDFYAFQLDMGQTAYPQQALENAVTLGVEYITAMQTEQFPIAQYLSPDIQQACYGLCQEFKQLQQAIRAYKQQLAQRAQSNMAYPNGFAPPQGMSSPMGHMGAMAPMGQVSQSGVDPRLQAASHWGQQFQHAPAQNATVFSGGNRGMDASTQFTMGRFGALAGSSIISGDNTPAPSLSTAPQGMQNMAYRSTMNDPTSVAQPTSPIASARVSPPPPPRNPTMTHSTPTPAATAVTERKYPRNYFAPEDILDDTAIRLIRGRWKTMMARNELPADAPDPLNPPPSFYWGEDPNELIGFHDVKPEAAEEAITSQTTATSDASVSPPASDVEDHAPGKASTPEAVAVPQASETVSTRAYRFVDPVEQANAMHAMSHAGTTGRWWEGEADVEWNEIASDIPSLAPDVVDDTVAEAFPVQTDVVTEVEPIHPAMGPIETAETLVLKQPEVELPIADEVEEDALEAAPVTPAVVTPPVTKPVFVPAAPAASHADEYEIGTAQRQHIDFDAKHPYQLLHHPSRQHRMLVEDLSDVGVWREEIRERDPSTIPDMNYDEHVLNTHVGRRIRLGIEDGERITQATNVLRRATDQYWNVQADKQNAIAAGKPEVLVNPEMYIEQYPMAAFEGAESSIWMLHRVKLAEHQKTHEVDIFVGYGCINEPVFCPDETTARFYEAVVQCDSYGALRGAMKAYLGDVEKEVWEVVNRRATKMVNHALVKLLSFDTTACIQDFFSQYEECAVAIDKTHTLIRIGWEKTQKAQIERFLLQPKQQQAESYTANVCHFLDESSEFLEKVKYFTGMASYAYVGVDAADLDLGIEEGKPYLITDLHTPVLARLVKTMNHVLDPNLDEDADNLRHFIRTKDGVNYELTPGALMDDVWLISRL